MLFSRWVVSDSLQPDGLQHTRVPCPPLFPELCSNSCPLSRWCHPTISSSVVPFSPCLQSFPASGSFPMSRLFASGGQSTGASASASVLPECVYILLLLSLHSTIPSLQLVAEHRAELPVLYSSFPLAIYFTHGSAYMSMLPSQFIPTPPVSLGLFFVSASLVLLLK